MTNIEQLKSGINPMLWDNGSYSFLHLEINLKDTASKQNLISEKEQASCFVTLVHEYIHYMQNFTTTWGFTNFITYVDLFAAFFGDNILLDNNPSLPLFNGTVDKKFGSKNYLNYLKSVFLGISKGTTGQFLFQDTTQPDFSLIESSITDPYWNKEAFICYVAHGGKQIPLNELVLSENMAIVGSYLASGLTVEESKQTIASWPPQYHIIYSFLNNIFPDKNCLKLTYSICESSLLIVPYNKVISNILKFFLKNSDDLKSKNEDEIINEAMMHIHFEKSLRILLESVLQQLYSRVETFNKYKENYEFYKYVLDILAIFKNGLEERLKVNHTYRDRFDSEFLNYYAGKIYSPILVFADKQKSMLGSPDDSYINSVASFSGIMKVFHTAYFRNIQICPFNEQYSICTVAKGNECKVSALEVYNKPEYNGCIMNNALNIIGIKKHNRNN